MIQPLPLIVIVIITMIVVQPVIGYCRASSIWAANASSTTITTTTNNHDLHHNHGYIRGGCNDYATLKDSSVMLQDDNIEDAPAQEVKDNNRNNPEEYSIVGEESASSTTPKKSTRKALTVTSNTVVYTTDADFDIGSTINVNHDDAHDQLQLDSKAQPFDFIWVACSGRGTVVKVNTLTGAILGEYKSAPRADGSPSRTTVDKDGSVWLSNRNDIGPNGNGTIVHIGLLENNQCEDRNGDKIIQTSTGLGDIKVWANESGTRGVQTAEDECIVHYTEVSSTGTRHLSIDADNNVWVSGSSNQAFDKVKGGRYDIVDANGKHSGDILTSYPSVGYGGYGGLMDPNGFIWSARPLLRWDTSKPLIGANGDPAGDSIGPLPDGINWAGQSSPDSYGLCIDRQGNIWNTELGSGINKYAPDGTHIARYTHGFGQAQGCVVDKNDDVWVAHSINGGSTVGHLKNNGTYLGSIEVGSGPSGVAVDRAGKVWSTNKYDDTISRIDPSLNGGIGVVDLVPPVKLGDGCQPYNYGDMTGSTIAAPPNTGSWTVKYDHGSVLAAWGSIQWTSATPGDSSLTVQVRNNDVDPWKTVTNGQNLSSLTGQYLHVQVNFSRATSTSSSIGASPVLIDLSLILPTISTPSPTTPNPTNPPITLPTAQPTVQPSSPLTASPTMPSPDNITSSPTKSSGNQPSGSNTQNNIAIEVNNGSDSNNQNSNENGNEAKNDSDAENKNSSKNDNEAMNDNKNINKNDKKVKKEKKVEKIKQTSKAKNGSNAKNKNNKKSENEEKIKALMKESGGQSYNDEQRDDNNKRKDNKHQDGTDKQRDDNGKEEDDKQRDDKDKKRDDKQRDNNDKQRDDKQRDSNNIDRRKKDERDEDKRNKDSRENDNRNKRNKSNDLFHRL